ncbi:MAG: K+/H+ antiporter subunit F [Trueperaceae bacterium]|nr:K+/H+ antiporter subunit F [Trueperaceae bacterium]MCC6310914.1 K+/H+ antiporter subunit F [Trueperaceae bacterium]MCO5174603.1 K+/H+ antiporter subunit F [Trueperaceae bacterium]
MTAEAILHWGLLAAHGMLAIGLVFAAARLIRGPRAQDRVLAFDAVYLNAALQIVMFGMRAGQSGYLEAALVMTLLGFAGSSALAKFLMRGEVIE